jgi:NDP-sugar pyrophosphorylase family protein
MLIEYGVILAAGRGSRMGNATDLTPKALLPKQEDCLLKRQITFLRPHVMNLFVTVGYLGEKVKEFSLANGADQTIDTSGHGNAYFLQSPKMLGAAGKRLLVITCDNLMEAPLSEILYFDSQLDPGLTLVTRLDKDNSPGDRVIIDESHQVLAIGQNLISNNLASGLQIIDYDFATLCHVEDFRELWSYALKHSVLRVSPLKPSKWNAFDTLDSLKSY